MEKNPGSATLSMVAEKWLPLANFIRNINDNSDQFTANINLQPKVSTPVISLSF
jgi:hypothetical protein